MGYAQNTSNTLLETLELYLYRKRKLRRNLRKSMERLLAPEKHFAFRGRLLSLRVLPHCGISSRPSSQSSKREHYQYELECSSLLIEPCVRDYRSRLF